MIEYNLYDIFPELKKINEQIFNSNDNKNLVINLTENHNLPQNSYNIYNLFLEYQNELYKVYKNLLEPKFIMYDSFVKNFNTFLLEMDKYGIKTSPIKDTSFQIDYLSMISRVPNVSYIIFSNFFNKIDSSELEKINFIEKVLYTINALKNYSNTNPDFEIINLSDPDQFANTVFEYSSYGSLLESVKIYFHSILSGKLKLTLDNVLADIDPSSFFSRITCPLPQWPKNTYAPTLGKNFIAGSVIDLLPDSEDKTSLLSNLKTNIVYKKYLYLNESNNQIFWISENAINAIKSFRENVLGVSSDTVEVKIGDDVSFIVNKSLEGFDDILKRKEIDKENFIDSIFGGYGKKHPLYNLFSNLILDQNNIFYPKIIEIFIKKVNDIKIKYQKISRIPAESLDGIFQNFYESIESDKTEQFLRLSWMLSGEYEGSFKSNRLIVRNLLNKETIIKSNSSYNLDYISLLKESFNYNLFYDKLKEEILSSNNGVDIRNIIDTLFEETKSNFSNKIYFHYIENEEYIDINRSVSDQILTLQNNFISSKINEIKGDSSDLYDLSDSFKDLQELSSGSDSNDFKIALKIFETSSRLKLLRGLSYKEYMEILEKRKKQSYYADEIEKHKEYVKKGITTAQVISKLEHYTIVDAASRSLAEIMIESFKREGTGLSTGQDPKFKVKTIENSDNNTKKYVSNEITFSLLSTMLRNAKNSLINVFSFSELLDNLRGELTASMRGFVAKSDDSIIAIIIFWIKCLMSESEVSSPNLLEKNILYIFENISKILDIYNSNSIFKDHINNLQYSDSIYSVIINDYIKKTNFTKLETFINISSLVKFLHNYENNLEKISKMLIESNSLSKMHLNNYQTFLKAYIDFSKFLKNGGIVNINNYYNSIDPSEALSQVYKLKEDLISDPNFGPERAEKLLPDSRINLVVFFELDSCELKGPDFDQAFDKMNGNFDPKITSSIDNLVSTINQINDIRTYASSAKPKDEKVVKNNFAFDGAHENASSWRFRVLGDLDPQHFTIGIETNCCQRIGGPGAAAAIDSFINPLSSVIILEVKNNGGWTVASQSYFHIVPKLKYFILDNIEAGKFTNNLLKEKTGFNFFESYAILAKNLNNSGFKKVLCGKEFTEVLNVDSSKFKTANLRIEDPRHFEVEAQDLDTKYTDFEISDCYDLLSPSFKVPEIPGFVFTASYNINNSLIKIANNKLFNISKDIKIKKLASYLLKNNLLEQSNKVLLLGIK